MKAIIFTGYERSGGIERVSGAYRIATVLRKHGWDVEVIDFFYLWSLDQLKELIKLRNQAGKIDWIGFSATWINYATDKLQEMINDFLIHVKEVYPNIKTLAGGQNPSINFPMYNNIDYVVAGFGEVGLLEVLKHIYSNGKIKGIPRKNGWYVDANSFYPAWPISDLTVEYESRDFIYPGETLTLEFSRGCKFSCAFCNFPILGVKEDTTRDLTLLENELKKNYDNYGVTNYQVADETLNDRDEKLAKIGNIVKNIGFELNFNAFIRADILFSKPQQLDLLGEARVWGHYYGIETFNHQTGKTILKGMHPDKIKQGLLDTEKFFNEKLGRYRGTVSLVYGLPHETKESILDAQNWLMNNWSKQSVIAFALNISLIGNKSKIDENYEKYGYEIIKQEKREDLNDRHNFFANDLTIWKNANMSMYDAMNLSTKMKNEFPGTVDSWKLWSLLSLKQDLNKDWEDILRIKDNDRLGQDQLRERAKEIKQNYISKKLAL